MAWGSRGSTRASVPLNQPRTVKSLLFAAATTALHDTSMLRSSRFQLDELQPHWEGGAIIAQGRRTSRWQKDVVTRSCLAQKLGHAALSGDRVFTAHVPTSSAVWMPLSFLRRGSPLGPSYAHLMPSLPSTMLYEGQGTRNIHLLTPSHLHHHCWS